MCIHDPVFVDNVPRHRKAIREKPDNQNNDAHLFCLFPGIAKEEGSPKKSVNVDPRAIITLFNATEKS